MSERLTDGFGNEWETCGPGCGMQIVRPGKARCEAVPCRMVERITSPSASFAKSGEQVAPGLKDGLR